MRATTARAPYDYVNVTGAAGLGGGLEGPKAEQPGIASGRALVSGTSWL